MHVVVCARAQVSSDCGGLVVKAREHLSPSARSLAHYSVSSDLVDSIPEGRSRTTKRLGICFHYGGREKLIPPPAHIHTLT